MNDKSELASEPASECSNKCSNDENDASEEAIDDTEHEAETKPVRRRPRIGRTQPRPRVISVRRLKQERMTPVMRAVFERDYTLELLEIDTNRPRSRADCADAPRPCPYVGCEQHMYLDVKSNGAIRFNFPHLEPHEMKESCRADLNDRCAGNGNQGGMTLDEVGAVTNLTRERVRQIEIIALFKLQRRSEIAGAVERSAKAQSSKYCECCGLIMARCTCRDDVT